MPCVDTVSCEVAMLFATTVDGAVRDIVLCDVTTDLLD